jgi:uncharacterized SAM-binding protein YcdF (DUF218 family)
MSKQVGSNVSFRRRHPSSSRRWQRHYRRAIALMLIALVGAIGYRRVMTARQLPQAVLVLGGSLDREQFAAEFAQQHPDLPIWVSSGSNPEYANWVFEEANIHSDRVYLDYRAVDTVTNFTTMVEEFDARGIQRIYLITSDYHMRRARVIGEIILGSHGISFEPIAVPSDRDPEPLNKVMRDAARSVLWVATGYSGSSLRRIPPADHTSSVQ